MEPLVNVCSGSSLSVGRVLVCWATASAAAACSRLIGKVFVCHPARASKRATTSNEKLHTQGGCLFACLWNTNTATQCSRFSALVSLSFAASSSSWCWLLPPSSSSSRHHHPLLLLLIAISFLNESACAGSCSFSFS